MIIKHTMTLLRKPVLLALLALPFAAFAADKPRPAPAIKPLPEYPMNEVHEEEKVSVAVDPCDDLDDCPFFRLAYVSHGFVAVRVIIKNDRDDALSLDEVRIQFLPAMGDKEAAATDEDLNRRLFSRKQAAGTRLPIIPITIHHEPVDKQILNDDSDFGFASTIVPPHSTRAGYVFYDTRDVDEPALRGAELVVKEMRYSDVKGQQHELFSFTLPFDKWLDAQDKKNKKADKSDKSDKSSKPDKDKD